MNPAILLAAGAALLLLAGRKGKRASGQPCQPLSPAGGELEGIRYSEVVTGGAGVNDELPMAILLHGRGSKGASFAKFAREISEPMRFILPDGILPLGGGRTWTRLRARTGDQAGLADEMEYAAAALVPFVREISRCRPTIGKPVITGHSQGGMMSFALASLYPNLFKAAVPVSGWLPVELWTTEMTPTYAIHGTGDRTVDFARTQDFAARLAGQGAPLHFTPVGGGHGFSGDLRRQWVSTIEWANE